MPQSSFLPSTNPISSATCLSTNRIYAAILIETNIFSPMASFCNGSLPPRPSELLPHERRTIFNHFTDLLDSEQDTRLFEVNLSRWPNPLVVKQGNDILSEADTQVFFYTRADGDNSAPRIPKVVDAFVEECFCFMVMEKISGLRLSDISDEDDDDTIELAAAAVKWLSSQLPWIPKACFGRISSTYDPVWHPFFKDHRAPSHFADAKSLVVYVAEVSKRCRSKLAFNTTNFGNDCIYHADITKDNFLLNSGRICIVDFQHIGVLPEIFQIYAFFNNDSTFAQNVGKRLGFWPSTDADSMVAISAVLQQSGGKGRFTCT